MSMPLPAGGRLNRGDTRTHTGAGDINQIKSTFSRAGRGLGGLEQHGQWHCSVNNPDPGGPCLLLRGARPRQALLQAQPPDAQKKKRTMRFDGRAGSFEFNCSSSNYELKAGLGVQSWRFAGSPRRSRPSNVFV
jgi:hypothetical protein